MRKSFYFVASLSRTAIYHYTLVLSLSQALIIIYSTLKEGYEKVVEVNRNGKRLLGTYFRVALFGQTFFEDEHGMQYIYKVR